MPPRIETILKKIYYDPSHPAGYGSISNLLQAARARRKNVTLAQVERWLQGQDAYTLHRKINRRFPQRKFVSKGLNHIWQADLVDMQAIQKENAGRRYLLTVIDVFSRRASAKAIKSKQPHHVIEAFSQILREAAAQPKFLHVDRGREFTNQQFRNFLEKKCIVLYHTFNPEIKCSIVERWHRTLKDHMFRYFTAKNTLHYLTILPKLVSAYNRKKHRSLGVAPKDVTRRNEKSFWEKQYGAYLRQRAKKYQLKINDTVRITLLKRPFQRGYERGWKREVFRIVDRFPTHPPTYKLSDLNNKVLEGTFYEQELGKVTVA